MWRALREFYLAQPSFPGIAAADGLVLRVLLKWRLSFLEVPSHVIDPADVGIQLNAEF
jgi:hypothetical protein